MELVYLCTSNIQGFFMGYITCIHASNGWLWYKTPAVNVPLCLEQFAHFRLQQNLVLHYNNETLMVMSFG